MGQSREYLQVQHRGARRHSRIRSSIRHVEPPNPSGFPAVLDNLLDTTVTQAAFNRRLHRAVRRLDRSHSLYCPCPNKWAQVISDPRLTEASAKRLIREYGHCSSTRDLRHITLRSITGEAALFYELAEVCRDDRDSMLALLRNSNCPEQLFIDKYEELAALVGPSLVTSKRCPGPILAAIYRDDENHTTNNCIAQHPNCPDDLRALITLSI